MAVAPRLYASQPPADHGPVAPPHLRGGRHPQPRADPQPAAALPRAHRGAPRARARVASPQLAAGEGRGRLPGAGEVDGLAPPRGASACSRQRRRPRPRGGGRQQRPEERSERRVPLAQNGRAAAALVCAGCGRRVLPRRLSALRPHPCQSAPVPQPAGQVDAAAIPRKRPSDPPPTRRSHHARGTDPPPPAPPPSPA